MSLLLLVDIDDRPLLRGIVSSIEKDLGFIREHDLDYFVAEPEKYGMLGAEPLLHIGHEVMLLPKSRRWEVQTVFLTPIFLLPFFKEVFPKLLHQSYLLRQLLGVCLHLVGIKHVLTPSILIVGLAWPGDRLPFDEVKVGAAGRKYDLRVVVEEHSGRIIQEEVAEAVL